MVGVEREELDGEMGFTIKGGFEDVGVSLPCM